MDAVYSMVYDGVDSELPYFGDFIKRACDGDGGCAVRIVNHKSVKPMRSYRLKVHRIRNNRVEYMAVSV